MKLFVKLVLCLAALATFAACATQNDMAALNLEQRAQSRAATYPEQEPETYAITEPATATDATTATTSLPSIGEEAPQPAPLVTDGDIIDITERFFVNQMMEVFLNYDLYLGRTIRYEGMFKTIHWDNEEFVVIVRYTLGCCSPEEMIGFEILLEGNQMLPDDTWVEIVGVLDLYNEFLVLRAISITEMDERGEELVF